MLLPRNLKLLTFLAARIESSSSADSHSALFLFVSSSADRFSVALRVLLPGESVTSRYNTRFGGECTFVADSFVCGTCSVELVKVECSEPTISLTALAVSSVERFLPALRVFLAGESVAFRFKTLLGEGFNFVGVSLVSFLEGVKRNEDSSAATVEMGDIPGDERERRGLSFALRLKDGDSSRWGDPSVLGWGDTSNDNSGEYVCLASIRPSKRSSREDMLTSSLLAPVSEVFSELESEIALLSSPPSETGVVDTDMKAESSFDAGESILTLF